MSAPRTERLLGEGRMPVLAGLRERAPMQPMADVDGIELLHGAVFFTMPTGRRPSRTGRFYPFVWNGAAQRVEPDLRPVEHSVWCAASEAGKRVVLIDPYEGHPGGKVEGAVLCGWQLHNRVTLRRLGLPEELAGELRREHGGSDTLDEVYGRPSLRMLRRMATTLSEASGRVATAAEQLVDRVRPDLLWCHLIAAHVGGHLFWDSSQVAGGRTLEEAGLGDALDGFYERTDEALGRIVAAAGDDATLLVVAGGHGRERQPQRPDGRHGRSGAAGRTGGRRNRTQRRLAAARRRADRAARRRGAGDARSSGAAPGERAVDQRRRGETKAFAPPAEPIGAVQLNVRGRERDGCVDPADVPALVERLREGLLSFRDRPGGGPAVAAVHETRAVLGEGTEAERFPDLLVEWNPASATDVDAVARRHTGWCCGPAARAARPGAPPSTSRARPGCSRSPARVLRRTATARGAMWTSLHRRRPARRRAAGGRRSGEAAARLGRGGPSAQIAAAATAAPAVSSAGGRA